MEKRRMLKRTGLMPALAILIAATAAAPQDATAAVAPSIFDIQYTADPAGDSPLDGRIIDCAGGIVTHKFAGSRPRIVLYDPANPDGWGGIQVKDNTLPGDANHAFGNVQIGDWVSFTNVMVEEYRGTTFLQYDSATSPTFLVESPNNAMPAPITVSPDDIPAPTESPAEFWLVADHAPAPEKYESMIVRIQDVTVSEMDQGKALDNYALSNAAGSCWASDYMNEDRSGLEDYHSLVTVGQHFQGVSGIFEQYTKIRDTYAWDYYQVLTTSDDSLVVPEPASICLLLFGGAGLVLRRQRKQV